MESSEQHGGDASPDAVELIGYLRKVDPDKYQLCKTPDCKNWVEILSVDLVEPLPVGGGQVRPWVRREATLVWCERVSASHPYPPPLPPGGGRWPRP